MRFTRERKKRLSVWDMTPMIDVVLQLIIFFMYTAQFSQATRTPMELPDEPGDETAEVDRGAIVVDMLEDGSLVVERTPMEMARVIDMIGVEAERLGSPDRVDLLIRAHRDAPAAHLNQLATRLSAIGVTYWKLGTSEQTPGGSR